MSAWADYVEWSGLDESKLRHPAGKGLVSDEVRQAQMDAEACAVASANWRPVDVSPRARWVDAAGITVALLAVALAPELASGWIA